MKVTSLELCKELHELSGWGRGMGNRTGWEWTRHESDSPWRVTPWGYGVCAESLPAYDLGYLLRRLPQNTWIGYIDTSGARGYALASTYAWNEKGTDMNKIAECQAETPEDAACLLAMKLFKQGVLTRKE